MRGIARLRCFWGAAYGSARVWRVPTVHGSSHVDDEVRFRDACAMIFRHVDPLALYPDP